jgi:uracil-DNA glycosylase
MVPTQRPTTARPRSDRRSPRDRSRGPAPGAPGSASAALPVAGTVREHERLVRACDRCSLHLDRTAPVVGDGPADARLVIVGAVPRRHEDLQGHALAGSARNVLDAALLDAGIGPDTVRVTSVVRCRPADDRPPTAEEVATCAAHLRSELAVVRPAVVVGLGAMATMALLGRDVPLERVAGYRLDVLDGITLVPTYHPTDVVRGVPQARAALRRDLTVARAVLEGRMGTGAEALADLRARLPRGG